MFTLFKKRSFGDYFSDTIAFFKTFGKHYFKNYFIINGAFLLVLVVLIYFVSKIYMETVFSSINNPDSNYLDTFINRNLVLFIGLLVLFVLLISLLSLINITYPILYLELTEKNNGNDFTTSQIISSLKQNAGRMFVFFLGLVFIILPLMIIVFSILILLCFVLIGIPLLLIIGPAFLSWIALSYHEYLIKKTGFFEALTNGFRLVKQQFWAIVGTTVLMSFLVQMLQGLITFIPYIIGIVYMFSSSESFQDGAAMNADRFSFMAVFVAFIMVLSVLLSYFFNNFLIVNQGLIYYSLRETNENHSAEIQINNIGNDFE